MSTSVWRTSHRALLDLCGPRVVAILNVTPDSFADGGRFVSPQDAARAALAAVEAGAAMLDVGGESTRPGSVRVGAGEQIARVVPALRAIRAVLPDVPISIDTTLAGVAAAALDAGANAVNDVSAGFEDPAMLPLIASRGAGIILMHRLAPPANDSYSDEYKEAPRYGGGTALPSSEGTPGSGVVHSVRSFLAERLNAALGAGIAVESIVLDPGLGFGKSVAQNLELIRGTPELLALGRPIVSALSRKSFVGRVGLGKESVPAERLASTLALSVLHYTLGARLFRVHDVRDHVEVLNAAVALGAPEAAPTQ